jgi:hypothetical protein
MASLSKRHRVPPDVAELRVLTRERVRQIAASRPIDHRVS